MEEMIEEETTTAAPVVPRGRRRLLSNAFVAGLGALLATEVACGPLRTVKNEAATNGPAVPSAGGGKAAPNSTAIPGTAPGASGSASAKPGAGVSAASAPTADPQMQHLLRRAGFGASPTELAEYQKLGFEGAVDRLVDYDKVDNRALEQRLTGLGINLNNRQEIQRWWLVRMIYTQRPLEEKMTLFWHGLLTSAISKVHFAPIMLTQNDFLRANALGRFPDLLKGITQDPAMMIWLDTDTNKKGHANENYARELMELFSLGVGNYTETDVREAARALTGLTLRGVRILGQVESTFVPRLHDDGSKTLLGHTGNFNADDIVDIIVAEPASAKFITRKLFSFFVYPNPPDDVLAPFVKVYQSNNYSIKELVRALLKSPEFQSPQAYRAVVKSPADLVAGTARLLGIDTDGKGLPALMTRMGQELFNPPNVAGWPGGPAWLSSGTWMTRLNFANLVTALADSPKDPSGPAHDFMTNSATSPGDAADQLADVLLDGQVQPAQRQVLADYLTPPSSGGTIAKKAWLDDRRRGALYLALAMPEYHLA
ncbi:MAG TPA: DUF1800 family protein [Chloroflexota bacterium]|nr:DUF1800 family protein [Chloroflexota bacterium]